MIGVAYKYMDMGIDELTQLASSELQEFEAGSFKEGTQRNKELGIMSAVLMWRLIMDTVDEAHQNGWSEELTTKYAYLVKTKEDGEWVNNYRHDDEYNIETIIDVLKLSKKKIKKYLDESIAQIYVMDSGEGKKEPARKFAHGSVVTFNIFGSKDFSIVDSEAFSEALEGLFDKLSQGSTATEATHFVKVSGIYNDDSGSVKQYNAYIIRNNNDDSYYFYEDFSDQIEPGATVNVNAYALKNLDEFVGYLYGKMTHLYSLNFYRKL